MPEWLVGAASTVGMIAIGFLGWVATRKQGDRERIKALEARQDKQDERNLKWQNYANLLRQHITDSKPPPAPDFPDGLFD